MSLWHTQLDEHTSYCWETGPSEWEPMNWQKKTEPDGSGRKPTESDENRKHGLIRKYVPMRLLRLYL